MTEQLLVRTDQRTTLQRQVLAATGVSYVIVLLDTSIVNVALNNISGSLAIQIDGLQWIVTAYTLAFAGLLLSGGTLGDRWGHVAHTWPGCWCLSPRRQPVASRSIFRFSSSVARCKAWARPCSFRQRSL